VNFRALPWPFISKCTYPAIAFFLLSGVGGSEYWALLFNHPGKSLNMKDFLRTL
jgi:hypothetical protein